MIRPVIVMELYNKHIREISGVRVVIVLWMNVMWMFVCVKDRGGALLDSDRVFESEEDERREASREKTDKQSERGLDAEDQREDDENENKATVDVNCR